MDLTPPCARCGHDAEVDIAELWLCLDCYHVAGSTCAGVGPLARTRSTTAGTASGDAAVC